MRRADAAMYEAKGEGSGSIRWFTSLATARTRLRYTLAQQLEAAIAAGSSSNSRSTRASTSATAGSSSWSRSSAGATLSSGCCDPRRSSRSRPRPASPDPVDLGILELACRTVHRWSEDGLLRQLPVTVHVTGESLDTRGSSTRSSRCCGARGSPRQARARRDGDGARERERPGDHQRRRPRRARGPDDRRRVRRRVRRGRDPGSRSRSRGSSWTRASSTASRAGAVPPVVAAVMAVADRLALSVTASGVGDAEQAERLRAVGCGSARGPYLAPAVLAGTLERRLRGVDRGGERRAAPRERPRGCRAGRHRTAGRRAGPGDGVGAGPRGRAGGGRAPRRRARPSGGRVRLSGGTRPVARGVRGDGGRSGARWSPTDRGARDAARCRGTRAGRRGGVRPRTGSPTTARPWRPRGRRRGVRRPRRAPRRGRVAGGRRPRRAA
jgi:hypothetical protein